MNKFRFNILIATVFYLLVFLFPKISESAPIYTVTNVSSTPTVLRGGSTSALYTITVTNTGTAATGVTITATPDTTNIKYLSSVITLGGGSTRTGITNPALNDSPMTWGTFSIPANGSVKILVSMTVVLATTTGNHNCNVSVSGTVIFTGTASATENINVIDSGITGKVFTDTNHNGTLDTGEIGISGVTMSLYKGFATTSCTTTTTNANGEYTFAVTTSSPASAPNFYYVIENGRASATCPPLASPPSGMGGSSILKKNVIFNVGSKITFNFGNYPLNAQRSFFEACPVDGYISEGANNSLLSSINLTNNLKSTIGTAAGLEYNAMAFNTTDKFLYAIGSGYTPQISSELIRIDSNGVALSLGEISGLPTDTTTPSVPSTYGAGDYNAFDNRFYVHALALTTASNGVLGGTNTIYAIDINTISVDSAKNIILPSANMTVDFSFNPTTAPNGVNYIYAMPQIASSNVLQINPNTGSLTTIPITGLPSSTYIASFFDPENNFFVEDLNTNLYKIHLDSTQTSGTVTAQILNNISIPRADGARCPFSKLAYSFTFTSNNQKYVVPGAIITYPHRLIAGTDGTVSLSITNSYGWPFTVFEDVNANNILDAGDLPITNFSNIGNVFAKTNSEMNLLIRVQIPLNTAANITDVMSLNATLTPTPPTTLSPITIMNIDQTIVTKQATGELMLIKTAKSYLSDGTTLYDSTGRTAKPGYYIDYFIDYKNISNGTLNNIKITDFVPAYTTLINSGFTAPATGTIIQATPLANTKDIIWNVNGTLAQTEAGQVFFRVKLN